MTAVAVVVAAVIGWQLWAYYMEAPWTRDGRVRADVVLVAPDVAGLVADVVVQDNQSVHRGDLLFRIDAQRYVLALQQAEATLASNRATMEQAQRDAERALSLNALSIAKAQQEQAVRAATVAQANYDQALAARAVAQLNVARTPMATAGKAPSAHRHHLELRPGDYVNAGQAVLAQVELGFVLCERLFRGNETARIHVGDLVSVRLMGENRAIHGHVESIARGIADRERAQSPKSAA